MEKQVKIRKEIGGYTIFEKKDRFGYSEIRVRNVSSKNQEHALQFIIEESPVGSKRTKYSSFSLPKEVIPQFIEALKEVKN